MPPCSRARPGQGERETREWWPNEWWHDERRPNERWHDERRPNERWHDDEWPATPTPTNAATGHENDAAALSTISTTPPISTTARHDEAGTTASHDESFATTPSHDDDEQWRWSGHVATTPASTSSLRNHATVVWWSRGSRNDAATVAAATTDVEGSGTRGLVG